MASARPVAAGVRALHRPHRVAGRVARGLRRAPLPGPRGGASPLVVSVYGRGGVGKSALIARFGHEIAGHFPDGRLYADLRGAVDAPVRPEEVLIGFLRALGVRLTTDPGGPAELRKLWLTWTKGTRILICLDNARDADQVKDLIPAEPGCAVMVTSRQPLFLLNTYDKQLRCSARRRASSCWPGWPETTGSSPTWSRPRRSSGCATACRWPSASAAAAWPPGRTGPCASSPTG